MPAPSQTGRGIEKWPNSQGDIEIVLLHAYGINEMGEANLRTLTAKCITFKMNVEKCLK